jgi:hypothetical protein
MTDDAPDRTPTTRELVAEFLKERFLSVILVGAILLVLAAYVTVDWSLPRPVEVFTFAFVLLLPVGYVVASYAVSLLWSPDYVYLLDIDAREIDGALFAFPRDSFQQMEVVDGDLDQLTPSLAIGKKVDLEAMTVKGTWRGTMSDRELLRALEKIDECRSQLEDDAKRGFAIETKAWSIIRNATRKAVLSVVDTFEAGTLPDDGDSIDDEIEAAIEKFDLDKKLRETNDGDTPEDSLDDDLDAGLQEDRGDDHADPLTPTEEPADD